VDVVLFGFVNFKKLLDYVQEYYPFFEYNCFVILKKYFNNILDFHKWREIYCTHPTNKKDKPISLKDLFPPQTPTLWMLNAEAAARPMLFSVMLNQSLPAITVKMSSQNQLVENVKSPKEAPSKLSIDLSLIL